MPQESDAVRSFLIWLISVPAQHDPLIVKTNSTQGSRYVISINICRLTTGEYVLELLLSTEQLLSLMADSEQMGNPLMLHVDIHDGLPVSSSFSISDSL